MSDLPDLQKAITEAEELRREVAAESSGDDGAGMTIAVQLGRIADVLERWEQQGFPTKAKP